jgi:hypothetical protein
MIAQPSAGIVAARDMPTVPSGHGMTSRIA